MTSKFAVAKINSFPIMTFFLQACHHACKKTNHKIPLCPGLSTIVNLGEQNGFCPPLPPGNIYYIGSKALTVPGYSFFGTNLDNETPGL